MLKRDETAPAPSPMIPWWVGGLGIGLLLVVATALVKPLGVSTQYAAVDGVVLHQVAPTVAEENVYLAKVTKDWSLATYGFFFVLGIPIGAFAAAVATRRFRPRAVPPLWVARYGTSKAKRFTWAFVGGFLLLFGSRLAGGCTSGHMISGVSQLAMSSIVFTAALFGTGILVARWIYRDEGNAS